MNTHSVLPEVPVLDECNYIAVFLTMACPYRCSYCINEYESPREHFRMISTAKWVRALSRLTNLKREQGEVPITLSGGEPSMHPGFYDIINELPERIRIDILTNLSFDVDEMIARVNPDRLRREAPYASIRVSYHPDQMNLDDLLAKTHRLMAANFSVGIWGVLHPDQEGIVLEAQKRAHKEGIDFRTKEFLGLAYGRLYGQFKFPDACTMEKKEKVLCRTSELIMGPNGSVYRCHHDLYENCEPVGYILDPDFRMTGEYLPCECYGHCNPCDLKVKTNRLQQFGYTAVSIKFPQRVESGARRLTGSATS
ncbi:MAG: radical SAM protein [Sedimentisphaerales bacterium]|nr:radical SAM protein [Sedimentisphaerales bacterium]